MAELLYRHLSVPRPDRVDGTHNGITLLKISAAQHAQVRRGGDFTKMHTARVARSHSAKICQMP